MATALERVMAPPPAEAPAEHRHRPVALLYGLYRRVMALSPPPPSPPTWQRDSCEPTRIRRRATVLEAVLTLSVIASVIALCTWFLTMAHCSQALCGA